MDSELADKVSYYRKRQHIRGYELPLPDRRWPGNVLVDVDYGRMELRILAARSRDSAMLADATV